MYCFDANVWIYYFDERLTEHERVVEFVEPIIRNEPLFTTTVLQMEVLHYLYNSLESGSHTEQFLDVERAAVAALRAEDVRRGDELLDQYGHLGIGGRDASVIAAMEREGVSALLSHDGALRRLGDHLEWLSVTDPVSD